MGRQIDCKSISEKIRLEIKEEISTLPRAPRLVVIQVGDDPASTSYVTGKEKACKEVGIDVTTVKLPEDITQSKLYEIVKFGCIFEEGYGYNNIHEYFDIKQTDGILVQLPLPKHIDERGIINAIPPEKDVDGFTPVNIGKMMLGDKDTFIPCTPAGILEILKAENIKTEGKNVVVVGRSNIVGRPIANLLSQKPWNATVTICHSYTDWYELRSHTLHAEIIILAVGKPDMLRIEHIQHDDGDYGYSSYEPVVIDVGVNRIPDETKKNGFRLVGDMSDECKKWCGAYTPVPSGVGPMTITMLLKNTLQAYKNNKGNNK